MSEERGNLYAVLGLRVGATQDQIRHAYRDLVRRHHPDTRARHDPADPAAVSDDLLRQVFAAYAVLGDPARRARYDEQTRPRSPRPVDQPPIQAGPVRWHPA
jgi:curved DNA-binding protein CbpA